MLLAVIGFTAQEFHWHLQDIYDESLLSLLLLMRQKLASEGREGITLEQKEQFMNRSWDDLVRESREKMFSK